jgi:carbon monoxide dehydrogenase subunit G
MPTVSESIDIPAPADKVWAVIDDMSRYGEWNTSHADFPDGPPRVAADESFKEKVSIMGMPGEATWTFTEVEPDARLVMDGKGPMGITLGQRIDLAGNGDQTSVTFGASFDGGPLAGPMGDSLAKSAGKAAGESLEKLRDLVV